MDMLLLHTNCRLFLHHSCKLIVWRLIIFEKDYSTRECCCMALADSYSWSSGHYKNLCVEIGGEGGTLRLTQLCYSTRSNGVLRRLLHSSCIIQTWRMFQLSRSFLGKRNAAEWFTGVLDKIWVYKDRDLWKSLLEAFERFPTVCSRFCASCHSCLWRWNRWSLNTISLFWWGKRIESSGFCKMKDLSLILTWLSWVYWDSTDLSLARFIWLLCNSDLCGSLCQVIGSSSNSQAKNQTFVPIWRCVWSYLQYVCIQEKDLGIKFWWNSLETVFIAQSDRTAW